MSPPACSPASATSRGRTRTPWHAAARGHGPGDQAHPDDRHEEVGVFLRRLVCERACAGGGRRVRAGRMADFRRRSTPYDPAMTASTAAATASREPPVAAYAACRRLLRRHDPTFYLRYCGFWPTFTGLHAPYGFVRGADEIVDRAGRSVSPPRASPRSTRGSARSNAGWPEGRRITR